jgi:hypothetical protein
MTRIRRAAWPRLTMSPAWDELRLNGQLVHGVRPRSRGWWALEALMRKAPLPVTTEELFGVCAETETPDPKAAVRNVLQRLRVALQRLRHRQHLAHQMPGGRLAHLRALRSHRHGLAPGRTDHEQLRAPARLAKKGN